MISKFLRPSIKLCTSVLVRQKIFSKVLIRNAGDFFPPSQYDRPFPKKLRLFWAMRVYWEIIPLIITTLVAVGCCVATIIYSFQHKVDVVLKCRSREYISRTMDLRNPTVHKMVTINQKYEPWPEMQDVLDKMKEAEKRALARAQSCSTP